MQNSTINFPIILATNAFSCPTEAESEATLSPVADCLLTLPPTVFILQPEAGATSASFVGDLASVYGSAATVLTGPASGILSEGIVAYKNGASGDIFQSQLLRAPLIWDKAFGNS